MRISFNIILDELRDLQPVTGRDFDGSQSFRRVVPLNVESMEADCLYVDSLRSWNGYPESGCVLLAEDIAPFPKSWAATSWFPAMSLPNSSVGK